MRLTRDQVRRIDALAAERYAMPGLILMENAGRGAAEVIDRVYGPKGQAFVACGTGNNGGDGCVIARHLHNRGWAVRLLVAGDVAGLDPRAGDPRVTPDLALNLAICAAMGLPIGLATDAESIAAGVRSLTAEHLLIDALLGTGFRGTLRPPVEDLLRAIASGPRRAVVAVDLPSGMDCDTGVPAPATLSANLTVSLVAEKACFAIESTWPYLGRVEVAEIGVPRELIEAVARGRD